MPQTLKKPRRKIHVGPADAGRRMSLDDFDDSIGEEGYLYELNKGMIEVSNVPHPLHLAALQAVRNQLIVYQVTHPDVVHTVAGSNDSKLLLEMEQSERHPDVSVYLAPPPDTRDVWSIWVPAIVVEVVSPSSVKRDYQEKPPEYLQFGIAEYWIIDPAKRQMTANSRFRGAWRPKVYKAAQVYSTPLLPEFKLDLKQVFPGRKD